MTEETSWGLIEKAGDGEARDRFSSMYLPVVRAYLRARWRNSLVQELEDAVQEVFVECFRDNGVLRTAHSLHDELDCERGFRSFLLGAVRNVALRVERRHARRKEHRASGSFHASQIANEDPALSKVFDRAWASSVMQQAAQLMREQARIARGEHERRVELLHLRFHEGMPVREVARKWNEDPSHLHAKDETVVPDTVRLMTPYGSPPDITHRESLWEGVVGVDDVLGEAGDPGLT